MAKSHTLHRPKRYKRTRKARINRELEKAWYLPTRLLADSWRWIQWLAMACVFPFFAIWFIYKLLKGEIHPVWDGG